MRCSTYFAIIALTLTLASSPASADIIYNVDNYPGLQNGASVTGTITTNGTLGSDITDSSVITSWDLTFKQGGATAVFNEVNGFNGATATIGGVGGLDITATSITLNADSSLTLSVGGEVSDNLIWSSTSYSNHVTGLGTSSLNWGLTTSTTQFGAPSFSPIAEAASSPTPEPASLTLMLTGAGALAGAGIVRRRRRAAVGSSASPPNAQPS